MDLPKDTLDLLALTNEGMSLLLKPNEGITITLSPKLFKVQVLGFEIGFSIVEGKLALNPSYDQVLSAFLLDGEFEHLLTKLEVIKFLLENKKLASEIFSLGIYR